MKKKKLRKTSSVRFSTETFKERLNFIKNEKVCVHNFFLRTYYLQKIIGEYMNMETLKDVSLFISKTCDIQEGFFDKSLVVYGDVNIRNTEICEGGLYISEKSKVFCSSITSAKTYRVPFNEAEKAVYDLSLKSIELSESKKLSTGCVADFGIQLKGSRNDCNIFTFRSDNIYNSNKSLNEILQIFIDVPLNSTVIVNIIGQKITFNSIEIYYKGEVIDPDNQINIIWNFSECSLFCSSFSKLYGVFLVPFGKCKFKKIYLQGKVIAKSVSGSLEVCDIDFEDCWLFEKKKSLKEDFKKDKCHIDVKECKQEKIVIKKPREKCHVKEEPIKCKEEVCCHKPIKCEKPVECEDKKISRYQAYNDVIESIALEEAGLANILISEGLKVERAIDLACNTDDLIKVNSSVKKTLAQVSHNQMLLQYKLTQVQENISRLCNK